MSLSRVVILGCATICACARTPRSVPPGTKIAVQAFAISHEAVIERYSGSPDAVGMRFAELLAARLKELGYDAVAVPHDVPLEGDLRVTGTVADIDGGSTAKRVIWGMGSGGAEFDVFGAVHKDDGTLVGEFTESRRNYRGWGEDAALDGAMERTINMIARMIYTGQYRRNAPPDRPGAQQFKASVAASAATPNTEDRLRALDRLRDNKMISPDEYDAKRREILKDL